MSTSKHIDIICVAALLCTLLVTVLFINGRALGIVPVTDGGAGDSRFTANDRNGDWDASGAAKITLTGDGGQVSGGGAYILDGDVHIIRGGAYTLSGELTDGSVIIDADKNDKIWILLDGVSLHCEDSAAILVEQAGKVFLTLAEERSNVISCGGTFSEDAVSARIDGAVYSRDDLTINGGGSLSVAAPYRHGIVCNDNLVIAGGTIQITAAQDGIHANDSVSFADADLTINAGDDGITVSNDDETARLYVESGHISIPSCYEGIEAIDITIAGGVIDIRPTDDGINANGRGGNSAIHIAGGDITIINETGRDADGLDSNGSIDISGGNVFISVNTSSYALDYGSENGGVCLISGGRVVAAGGSAMAEGFDSSSEQCFIMYTSSAAGPGAAVTLKNEAGNTLVSEIIPCGFSSIVISTPELRMGETCTIAVDGSPAEITVDNSSSSSGFGMGGMPGGGQQGGFFGGRGGDGGRRGMDSTEPADGQLNLTALSAGNPGRGDFGDGNMPQMPGGSFGDGGMPQTPGGGFGDSDTQQMPGGGFGDGDMPQMPGGGFGDGGMPQMPGGGFGDGGMPQMPDGGSTDGDTDDGSARGGNWRGDQSPQWGQNQDRNQGGESGNAAVLPPETLLAVGISALVLLAGILAALKVRH